MCSPEAFRQLLVLPGRWSFVKSLVPATALRLASGLAAAAAAATETSPELATGRFYFFC